jgi:hypothetical protein
VITANPARSAPPTLAETQCPVFGSTSYGSGFVYRLHHRHEIVVRDDLALVGNVHQRSNRRGVRYLLIGLGAAVLTRRARQYSGS